MTMKKIYIIVMSLLFTVLWADCNQVPSGISVKQAIEIKSYDKAKSLLETFKTNVKKYLETCDKSEAMFEQTNMTILTYQDKLEDLKHDLNAENISIDCSKIPSSTLVEKAFKSKNSAEIKTQYARYKKDAESYIEHCATHTEYETVYESSMFCDELYDEWMQKNK